MVYPALSTHTPPTHPHKHTPHQNMGHAGNAEEARRKLFQPFLFLAPKVGEAAGSPHPPPPWGAALHPWSRPLRGLTTSHPRGSRIALPFSQLSFFGCCSLPLLESRLHPDLHPLTHRPCPSAPSTLRAFTCSAGTRSGRCRGSAGSRGGSPGAGSRPTDTASPAPPAAPAPPLISVQPTTAPKEKSSPIYRAANV